MRVLFITCFFSIASILSPGSAYRILCISSYNGKSHFIMHEKLFKGLAEHGHQVDVVSHFPLKTPFPNYNQVVNLAEVYHSIQNNVTYDQIKYLLKGSFMHTIVSSVGGDLCDLMDFPPLRKLINNPPNDPPYDLLIVDILSATCYLALGQHLKVPVVGVVASAMWPWVNDMVANPDNPAYIPSVLSDFDPTMTFRERVWNTLKVMYTKWEFYRYSMCQDEKIRKYIGPHAPSLREAERNVSLILVNSHHSLNGVRPFTTAVVEVGGLHVSENVEPLPSDLEKWLNDSKDGFVYISFGAMAKLESFPKTMLCALYASIAKLSPVRVLMKIANPNELPPGLPDNVLTRPWIAQSAVLNDIKGNQSDMKFLHGEYKLPFMFSEHKNVRAFMTHGGLMGTQEAIYFGVPLIGVPLFSDQGQNMRLYIRKHVAVSLNVDEMTEEKLNAAFNAVLNDPSYMKAAKKLSAQFRDRPKSALDTAIFWVEYVARNGGTNLRSPAMDLTWWQIAMLDVFGVLLFSAIFIIYLLIFMIKKLTKKIGQNRVSVVNLKKFK